MAKTKFTVSGRDELKDSGKFPWDVLPRSWIMDYFVVNTRLTLSFSALGALAWLIILTSAKLQRLLLVIKPWFCYMKGTFSAGICYTMTINNSSKFTFDKFRKLLSILPHLVYGKVYNTCVQPMLYGGKLWPK